MILTRIVSVPIFTYLPRLDVPLDPRARPVPAVAVPVLIISWAGIRGAVSLVAALALPSDFPQRDLIVFLTFAVILATLVLQGLTLPA